MSGEQKAHKEEMEVVWRDHEKNEKILEKYGYTSASSPRRQHCVKITCPLMKRDCSPFYLGCFTVDEHRV